MGDRSRLGSFAVLALLVPALAPAQQVDLAVSLTVAPAPTVTAAQETTWTASVENTDPSEEADSPVLVVTLPSPVVYTGVTAPTGWSCTEAGLVVTCNGATLPEGATATAVVTAAAPADPADGSELLTGTAAVSSATDDPDSSNDTAAASTTAEARADLSVQAVFDPDPVDAAEAVELRSTVTDGGPSTARDLELTVPVPAGFSYTGFSGDQWSCSEAGGTVTCLRGSLSASASTLVAVVFEAAHEGGAASATVTVSSATDDPDGTNDAATANVTVTPVADLAVTLEDAPDPVDAAGVVTYTVTASNAGPSTATGVTATVVLDADSAYAGFSGAGWTCSESGGTVTCTGPDLAAGTDSAFTIDATAPAEGGTIMATASVSGNEDDPDGSNQTDDEETVVTPVADLSVTVDDGATAATAGSSFETVTVVVSNAGPSTADGAVVRFEPPSDLVSVRWECVTSAGSGACGRPAGLGRIDESVTLGAGDAVTFTVTGFVAPGAEGVACGSGRCLELEASVAVPDGVTDPDGTNDTASDADTVLGFESDVWVSKTDERTEVVVGESYRYTIRVGGSGPSVARGVGLSDVFPAELLGHPVECGDPSVPCWTCEEAQALEAVARYEENQGSPQVAGMEGASGLAVTPDGVSAYVAGTVDDSIAWFGPAPSATPGAFGHLEYQGLQTGIAGPRELVVSPDGGFLYATAGGEQAVVGYAISPADGSLAEVGRWSGISGMTDPGAVVVSPDGGTVWVASAADDAIVRFSRDRGTGQLTWEETTVGDATVLLDGVSGLAVSPDGRSLYAAAPGDGSLTVFSVGADGSLAFVETHVGVGLGGVRGVAVSPDGTVVAAAAPGDGAVTFWSRDPSTGLLTAAVEVVDGVDGVSGLGGVHGLAWSPDGTVVAVVAGTAERVGVIGWDGVTSTATWIGAFGAGDLGVASLQGLERVVWWPRGRGIGVTASTNSTLDTIASTVGTACPAESGNGDIAETVDIPAGSHLEYTAWVSLSASASGTVTNTATATVPPDVVDPSSGNDSASDADTVIVATDLEVAKDDGATSAVPGERHAYTIVVTNRGVVRATGAVVTDDPPVYDGATVLAGYETGTVTWRCVAEGGACCQVGGPCGSPVAPVVGTGSISQAVDLPPGGSVRFTLEGVLHPSATGTLVNTATVSEAPGVAETDPSNNTASDDDTVLEPEPDVAVRKDLESMWRDDPGSSTNFDTWVQWWVTVYNGGPSRAEGVEVEDVLPPEIDGGTAAWTCTVVSGTGSCGAGSGTGDVVTTVDLDPGATARFVIQGLVRTNDQPATLTNTATASATGDPVSGNDSDTDVSHVGIEADLGITIDDGQTDATPGEPIVYTVQVENDGPTDADGATVDTVLPAGLRNVTWTCSAVSPIPGDLTFLEEDSWAGTTDGATGLAVGPDGKSVFVAAATANALAVFRRETTPGSDFNRLTYVDGEVDGQDDPSDPGTTADGLEGASAVAVTPDGSTVYVAGTGEDAIAAFHYDETSGTVHFIEVERQGADDPGDDGGAVDGVEGPVALAVSPDGKNLYVAGGSGDAIAVFDIAGGTGRLSFRQKLSSADIGGSGLVQPRGVAVSPDGAWVVVTGSGDDTVVLLERNGSDGTVSLADLETDGVDDPGDPGGPVQDMHEPWSVAFSPDGKQVYVGTHGDDSIVVFDLDADDSELSFSQSVPAGAPGEVLWVAVSADGEHVLAATGSGNAIAIHRRNTETGTLTLQDTITDGDPLTGGGVVDGLAGASSAAFTPDGLAVLVAGPGDGGIGVFDREGPQPMLPQIEVERDGRDDPADSGGTVDGLFGAWDVLVSSDGGHVYVAGYGDDAVAVFVRNEDAGNSQATRGAHLSFLESVKNGEAGITGMDGPVALATSPDPANRNLYVASRESSSIVVFGRVSDPTDPDYGKLGFVQSVADGDGADGLAGALDVVVHPSGRTVYVAGHWASSIAIFGRATDGRLTFRERVHDGEGGVTGLAGVSSLAISGDGKHLYAAATTGSDVAVFEIRSDGGLRQVQLVNAAQVPQGLEEPMGIAVTPDGAHVLVAARSGNSLVVLSRDADPSSETFGLLEPLEVHTDGANGETGLHGARSVAVSPDGAWVYLVAEYGDDIALFQRDNASDSATFGALTEMEVRTNGDRNVSGMDEPYGVAVAPSGRNVYVAALVGGGEGGEEGALAAFAKRSESACSAGGVGDVHDRITIAVSGTVTYTIRATIDPSARGTLTASATVAVPSHGVDPDPSNDTDSDDTDLTPVTGLAISKDDGVTLVGAGTDLTWTVTVTNRGPSDAIDTDLSGTPLVRVDDTPPPADFENVSWTCDAVGSGRLTAVQTLDGTGFAGASAVAPMADPDNSGPLPPALAAVSVSDDALVIMHRDVSSGQLNVVQTVRDGDVVNGAPADALDGARDVVASEDGLYLYVAAEVDDAVTEFQIDLGTGTMVPVQTVRDGVGGVDGLDRAVALLLVQNDPAASTDFLYVAGSNDGAVAVFARDRNNGTLTFLEAERDGANDPADAGGTVRGILGASGLAISPDGDHLYVTGSVSGAVAVFERDHATGALSFLEAKDASSTAGLRGATSPVVTPDGTRVLVAGRDDDAVVVFSRIATAGAPGYGTLDPVQVVRNGHDGVESMAGPVDLIVLPGSEQVQVSAHRSGALVLLRRMDDDWNLGFLDATRDAELLAGAGRMALSEDGAYLYSSGMIAGAVGVWRRGQESSCAAAGSGPVSDARVLVAAGGAVRFTLHARVRSDASGAPCPSDATLACVTNTATVDGPFESDTSDNQASDRDVLSRRADLAISKTDHHALVDGLSGAQDAVVTPDGRFVYAAGAEDNAIAIFRRDTDPASPGYGSVEFLGAVEQGEGGVTELQGVDALAISPDGAHLYAGAAVSNAISVFAIDPADGSLALIQAVSNGVGGAGGLGGAADLLMSRDGATLYVAGSHDNAVAWLHRVTDASDPDFGKLTPSGLALEDQDGLSGLVGVQAVAMGQDEDRLYAVSATGHLVVFDRASDGALTYRTTLTDGEEGVTGLRGGSGVAVTSDGAFVFATGSDPGSLALFSRTAGGLDFVETLGTGDVGALEGASGVALFAGDDAHVTVTASDAAAVLVFELDPSTGHLTFVESHANGDGSGAGGLAGAAGVAFPGDGEQLYAVSTDDASLVVFDRGTAANPGPGEGRLEFEQVVSDGSGAIAAGSENRWTVTVENLGPADARGVRVRDVLPAELIGAGWVCSGEAGGACPVAGEGSIDTLVELPAGGRVVFLAGGTVRPGFSGVLTNTATVASATEPAGVADPDESNNTATDSDTVVGYRSDLSVALAAGAAVAVPGTEFPVTMTVANAGPSSVSGASVGLTVPAALSEVRWTCEAEPAPGLLQLVQSAADIGAPRAVAVRPDGRYVYAAGLSPSGRDAVAVLARDRANGTLALVEIVEQGMSQDLDGDGTVDAVVDGLRGLSSLAVSPDGRFLYASGRDEDAVAWFAVDGETGRLAWSGVVRDGVGGVHDLGGPADVLVSPDGGALWVASPVDGAVTVFGVDSGSGAPSFLGVTGVSTGESSLNGVEALAVSPDGWFLYGASGVTDSVIVMARTGGESLEVRQVLAEGDEPHGSGGPEVRGLAGASGVAVSPDGNRVAVTGATQGTVAVFARDGSSGELEFAGWIADGDVQDGVTVSGMGGARSPVFSEGSDRLYVAGPDDAAVVVLSLDGDGTPRWVARADAATGVVGLGAIGGIALTVEDHELVVAGGAGGLLDVLAVAPGASCPAREGVGVPSGTVDLSPGGHVVFTVTGRIAPSASGTLRYEARVDAPDAVEEPDLSNNVAVLEIDPEAEAEVSVVKTDGAAMVRAGTEETWTITVTNAGPSDVAGVTLDDVLPVFPGEAAGLVDGTASWSCEGEAPLWTVGSIAAGDPDGRLERPGRAASSPDGRFLYVPVEGSDAVTVLSRDADPASPSYGTLAIVQTVHDGDTVDGTEVDGLAGASAVAVSPDGATVYVTGRDDDAVAVFARDGDDGTLSPLQVVRNADAPGLGGPAALAFDSAGRFLSVAGGRDGTIAVLERADDGTLAWVMRIRQGYDGVPLSSLDGIRSLAIVPDGTALYAVAQDAAAVSVFSRDQETGRLTWVQTVMEGDSQSGGLPEVTGLGLVQSVAVSPDGRLVATAALASDAVDLFRRDLETGELTLIQTVVDGTGSVDGLDGASDVVFSADGSDLYAVGRNDDAVVVAKRDWTSDTFAVLGVLGSTDAGPAGLDGPVGIVAVPSSPHLVVSGRDSDSLVVLERRPESACTAGGSGNHVQAEMDLAAGASVTLTVTGTVHPSSRGTLSNTAQIAVPSGVVNDPTDDAATDTSTVEVVTDLTVTKSNGDDTVVAGLPTTYEIVVTNAGPADALGAAVTDTMPVQLLSPAWTCTPGPGASCPGSGTGDIAATVDVPAGSQVTFHVTGTVDRSYVGQMANTVTVVPESGGSDPNPATNTATDTDAVVPVADLAVTKDDGVDEVIPGTAVTWTIVVTNAGPSDGSGTVDDIVPGSVPDATWTCVAGAGASCPASGTGSLAGVPVAIPAGSSVTFTLTGTVSPAALGTLSNTVTVTVDEGISDPDLLNNTATDVDQLTPEADLLVTKVDLEDPVPLEGVIHYTVTVTNDGPSDAQGVTVTDTLPAGTALIATSGCDEDIAGVPVCTLGPLAAGSSVSYEISAQVDASVGDGEVLTNTVTVGSDTTDPDPSNDTATEDTTVRRIGDLSVTKEDAPDPVIQGGRLTWTITVSNAGPNDILDAVVHDVLPSGVDFVATIGCAEDPNGTPDCTVGTVPAYGSREVRILVDVTAPANTTITNTATVTTGAVDPDGTNDDATSETDVLPGTDLRVTKTNGVDFVGTGMPVEYTIRVENLGPADAASVHVDDVVPPELIDATWTCAAESGAACGAASGSGDIADVASIPVGGAVVYVLSATVDPTITDAGSVVNTVTVSADGLADAHPEDNTATDADPLRVGRYFSDGFETGDTSRWSDSQGKR